MLCALFPIFFAFPSEVKKKKKIIEQPSGRGKKGVPSSPPLDLQSLYFLEGNAFYINSVSHCRISATAIELNI